MLRQQEAELNEAGHMICMLRWEIGELKQIIDANNLQSDIGHYKKKRKRNKPIG